MGPKYLVDEYAILDARYWVLQDPTVAWVCYLEAFVMIPLCFFWYLALQRGHWSRHYWCLLAGVLLLEYVYSSHTHPGMWALIRV